MWGLNPHNPRNPSSSSDEVGSRVWENICHHKRASDMLRLRQPRSTSPNTSRVLDRVIRRQLVSQAISRKHRSPSLPPPPPTPIHTHIPNQIPSRSEYSSYEAKRSHTGSKTRSMKTKALCGNLIHSCSAWRTSATNQSNSSTTTI